MVKISVDRSGQATITIPVDVMKMMGWDGNTELFFVPLVQNPKDELDKSTPIILKEIRKSKR